MSMTYLSEDPTLLVGGLLLLAGAFVVALRVTQQGKYLIRAIEWLWVTDNERIEQVVYDLRRGVLDSDVEGVLAHLTPDVQFLKGDLALDGAATRALIRANLEQTRFDFIRVSNLETSAGRQSRRGKAEFRVMAKGSLHGSLGTVNIGTADSVWSLGFQETEPGVWKVNRITPVRIPNGALAMPGGAPAPERPRLGRNPPGGRARGGRIAPG
jgi:ketosteroid isomerase-like protein